MFREGSWNQKKIWGISVNERKTEWNGKGNLN